MATKSGSSSGRLFLIDAHSLIFQVFHAIRDRMTSPAGLPTNAVFGFVRDVLYLRARKPDYLICAFDVSGPVFRSEFYPDYKAHRDPPPVDLEIQIPLIVQALDAMRVPVVGIPGYEADDVMATLARAGAERGLDVLLCSSDKDCRQLLTDRVRMYNLRKRQEFGREELLADWGVTPEQVVDLQTLVGDPVDNVPGVPGIGIKTAAKLLQEFGTLDNLVAHIDEVPGKKQESLRASLGTLEISRRLVRLVDDVPIEIDWDDWQVQDLDVPRLSALFKEWGFHSLLRHIQAIEPIAPPAPAPAAAPPRQRSLFDDGETEGDTGEAAGADGAELFPFGANADGAAANAVPASPSVAWNGVYHLVDTPRKFADFLKKLKKQKRFAVDLETTSLEPLSSEIVGFAFCWQEGEAWYVAVRGPGDRPHLDADETLEALRPIFEDGRIAKVNQNIKYDRLVLRGKGVEIQGVAGDSMVADYLLHAGERSHGLDDLAQRYFDHRMIPITDLIGKKTKKSPQLRMDQVPTERVAEYSGEDADAAWRLCELLEPRLESEGLRKLYDELEIPLIEVLAELEFNGIRLDIPRLQLLGEEMGEQLEVIEQEIYALAGHEFNIGSLPQLRKVLFEELKLPTQKKTGLTGAASTNQESLEKLAALTHLPGHLLPRKVLEYRQIDKLKGTYIDALPLLVNPHTGRVHTSFNQTVTSTGRISSSDPNLQNIPVRREQGQQIRQAFLPAEGWLLLKADYSQIELRLLAHFTGDEVLRQAFAEGKDIHALVAAQIYGIAESAVSPEQRRLAKTVNFGVIYGMSGHGLAERLGISRDEANRFIDSYFATYPRVLDYQKKLLDRCRATGYVSTILGRRRQIVGIRSATTYQQRNQPEREAINMEIQGSAADLIKLAMLELYRRLKGEKLQSRMLLQIHDELVFESPPDEVPVLAALVQKEMTAPLEKALGLEVRLQVDLAAGPNWLDVEKL